MGLFDRWATGRQRKELTDFVQNLRAMDGTEIGMVLAMATAYRHDLARRGVDLLQPAILLAADPGITFTLARTIQQHQKHGEMSLSAALMVWVHTLRATSRLELRQLGRDMWRELERGFPHAIENSMSLMALTGQTANIEGYDQFPDGLTPDPL